MEKFLSWPATYPLITFGFGRFLATFPFLINGCKSASYFPPQAHFLFPSSCLGTPFKGTILSLPHFLHLRISFAPDHLPRLARGLPSISIISIAKSTTGALLMHVPTQKASTKVFSSIPSFS